MVTWRRILNTPFPNRPVKRRYLIKVPAIKQGFCIYLGVTWCHMPGTGRNGEDEMRSPFLFSFLVFSRRKTENRQRKYQYFNGFL